MFVTIIFIFNLFLIPAKADELDEVENQLQQKQSEYQQTQSKIEQLKKQQEDLTKKLKNLSGQIWTTQKQIDELDAQVKETKEKLTEVENNLKDRQEKLARQQDFRDSTVRSYYKRSHASIVDLLLSSDKFSESAQNLAFQNAMLNEAKRTITALNQEIARFEEDKRSTEEIKKSLEENLAKIASLKKQLQAQAYQTQRQINEASSQKNALSGQLSSIQNSIKDLTARQQELIRQKMAATSELITVGSAEQDKQTLPAPGFSPAYAFFTYGYPHRVGMNQYGAYGRAKAGQDYQTILKAYYDNISLEKFEPHPTIPVVGYGEISLEDDYLKGIGEMPSSWGDSGGMEALKAQAVAARTFALNYIYYSWGSGGLTEKATPTPICTDQNCQVYLGRNKGGNWERAVEETRGMVMLYQGKPITAWYSSTDGGYTRTSGDVWGGERPWTKRVKDTAGDWPGEAYDGPKYGDSPWFHKAWGAGPRGNAWMTEEETEDIFNALLLSEKASSYNQYLTQPDKGGWSMAAVKEALAKEGIKEIGAISSIQMFQDGAGFTNIVRVTSANYAVKDFDGAKFRSMFNLRSLGTLVIWTSLYDVLRE